MNYKKIETELNNPMDFKKICRACCISSKQLVSIFPRRKRCNGGGGGTTTAATATTIINIAEYLASFTNATVQKRNATILNHIYLCVCFVYIQIAKNDGLPQKICSNCIDATVKAVEFKRMVEQSYVRQLSTIKSQKSSSSSDDIKLETVDGGGGGDVKFEQVFFPIVENNKEIVQPPQSVVMVAAATTSAPPPRPEETCPPMTLSTKMEADDDIVEIKIEPQCIIQSEAPQPPPSTTDVQYDDNYDNDYDDVDDDGGGGEFQINDFPFPKKKKLQTKAGKRYACPRCEYSFSSKGVMKRHLNTGNCYIFKQERLGIECAYCGEASAIYRVRRKLLHHFKEVHTIAVADSSLNGYYQHNHKRRLCPVCGLSLTDGAFAYHLSSHSNAKPFVCNVCSLSYREKRSLDDHMRTHTGEMPFVCPKCNERFRVKKFMLDHIKHKHRNIKKKPQARKKVVPPVMW